MEYSEMSTDKLIEMVDQLDNATAIAGEFNCFSAVDDLNEKAAEIRMILEDRGIEV